jgi:hypothetical protein
VNGNDLFLYGGIFAVVFAWSLLEGQHLEGLV